MKLKEIIPEFIVKDVSNSIKFYEDNLGFKVDMTVPDYYPYCWAQLSLGDYKIMLQEHSVTLDEIIDFPKVLSSTNLLVLKYDNVNETKELFNMFKDKEVKIFSDYKETEYGTVEFGVLDPDNYMILISAE